MKLENRQKAIKEMLWTLWTTPYVEGPHDVSYATYMSALNMVAWHNGVDVGEFAYDNDIDLNDVLPKLKKPSKYMEKDNV